MQLAAAWAASELHFKIGSRSKSPISLLLVRGLTTVKSSQIAIFAGVLLLALATPLNAETTYHLYTPTEHATYSRSADIGVSGSCGGSNMSDFANITFESRLYNDANDEILDTVQIKTDDYGTWGPQGSGDSLEFNIDGLWPAGADCRVEIWREGSRVNFNYDDKLRTGIFIKIGQ